MSGRTGPPQGTALLLVVRRDLETLRRAVDEAISRIDAALVEPPSQDGAGVRKGFQSYPGGYDFRDDPEGLQSAVAGLLLRVTLVGERTDTFTNQQLHHELCLRTAEARIYQSQTLDKSPEWDMTVNVVRSLTKIVAETRPGYVYGLAVAHQANWGRKIQEILSVYTPILLEG